MAHTLTENYKQNRQQHTNK